MADRKKLSKKFDLTYDEKEDILYISKSGYEKEFVEVAPGVNIEFDDSGDIIGIEIFRASRVLEVPARKRVRNMHK